MSRGQGATTRVVDADDPTQRAALLNRQMAAVAAYPRMTDHDGEGWHLHYRDDDRPLPDVLAAVRRAIESYPQDLRVVVVGTGGLSHQIHGERTGFNNTPWDMEFLQLRNGNLTTQNLTKLKQ